MHQTRGDHKIEVASDPKNGLGEAVLNSFDEVTEVIKRRTDKLAGDMKEVR